MWVPLELSQLVYGFAGYAFRNGDVNLQLLSINIPIVLCFMAIEKREREREIKSMNLINIKGWLGRKICILFFVCLCVCVKKEDK